MTLLERVRNSNENFSNGGWVAERQRIKYSEVAKNSVVSIITLTFARGLYGRVKNKQSNKEYTIIVPILHTRQWRLRGL